MWRRRFAEDALALALALVVTSGLAVASPAPARAADADPVVVEIAGGLGHACARLADGRVACWGSNPMGGLGTGTRYDSVIPQVVRLPGPAIAITAGESHSCAVLDDGSAWCWGRNDAGEADPADAAEMVLTPRQVAGPTGLIDIDAGDLHTCAVAGNGTAWCWGNGGNGQSGPAWTYTGPRLVQVPDITTAVDVVVGTYHTCLRLSNGDVTCFGYYPRPNGGADRSPTPTVVPGLHGATALSAGGAYTCAVMADQTVRCFGGNTFGTLGDGTQLDRPEPVAAIGIDDAIGIGSADGHTCAIRTGGTLACWGFNERGESGAPPEDPLFVLEPHAVDGLTGVSQVTGSGGVTCAVEVGVGVCWGENADGQLGDRTVITRSTPAPLSWVPDTTIPVTLAPTYRVRLSTELRNGAIRAAITIPVDDGIGGTGPDHLLVRTSRDGGDTWSTAEEHGTTWYRNLPVDRGLQFRSRAIDRVGNVGPWSMSGPVRARIVQQTSTAIDYRGAWRTGSKAVYAGGSIAWSTDAGATATFTFSGRAVGIVSRMADDRGSFRVLVDGVEAGTVDEASGGDEYRFVVFEVSWPVIGTHTVRIVNLGARRVDLDAFAILR